MTMTRKHFRLIADTIKNLPEKTTKRYVAQLFAVMCNSTNANFNWQKFERACGFNSLQPQKIRWGG
jgi:hypothetical protein